MNNNNINNNNINNNNINNINNNINNINNINNNNININQLSLDQYIGDNVDQAIEQLKAMYLEFDVQKLHQDLVVTNNYNANRIRVRHNNQFIVTSVTYG